MPAKETLKRNKTRVQEVLCGDYTFILNKVQEKELITSREYNNLKSINKENVEGHVVELVDKMMNKDSLAKVFSWLGFRVLMCKDQTRDQMKETLQCFASLPGDVQLQSLSLQEWSGSCFTAPQQILEHGDAFVCCILSHGSLGAVLGIDSQPLFIKDITRYFKATKESPLTGKPKMFLIQACQGTKIQQGVLLKDVEEDSLTSIPEEADVLVALATVEDHAALRHRIEGSWFVQSVCEQLKEHCPRYLKHLMTSSYEMSDESNFQCFLLCNSNSIIRALCCLMLAFLSMW
ncbi:hypothetical protein GOODEAATRI_024149 [Goodea atripinnis]|uniref:Caspase-8 n=1 Tax=Goodea atripinnis TaxID=208336 RepID=A0ABV0NFH1_9TELE